MAINIIDLVLVSPFMGLIDLLSFSPAIDLVLVSSHTRFILGNGSRIRFWDDVWCREMPLKEAFPGLYDIACDKNSFVAAHLILESGSFQWDVIFIHTIGRWTS
jgi:hypothetical protein